MKPANLLKAAITGQKLTIALSLKNPTVQPAVKTTCVKREHPRVHLVIVRGNRQNIRIARKIPAQT